jgi:hypothetical protein
MEVSGQLHVSAALLFGKEPPTPIVHEAGWTLESVWKLWRTEKVRAAGNLTRAVQLVAVPTEPIQNRLVITIKFDAVN